MSVTLHVCITCRAGQTLAEGETPPGARLHAAILAAGAPDGIVPWRTRPEIFRKQSLARLPPIAVLPEAAE